MQIRRHYNHKRLKRNEYRMQNYLRYPFKELGSAVLGFVIPERGEVVLGLASVRLTRSMDESRKYETVSPIMGPPGGNCRLG